MGVGGKVKACLLGVRGRAWFTQYVSSAWRDSMCAYLLFGSVLPARFVGAFIWGAGSGVSFWPFTIPPLLSGFVCWSGECLAAFAERSPARLPLAGRAGGGEDALISTHGGRGKSSFSRLFRISSLPLRASFFCCSEARPDLSLPGICCQCWCWVCGLREVFGLRIKAAA